MSDRDGDGDGDGDSDRDSDRGKKMITDVLPPPEKKLKLTAPQPEKKPHDKNPLGGARFVGPEHIAELERIYKIYSKEILLSCGEFDPLDVTNAVPIVEDLQELDRLGVHFSCFSHFLQQCHDRRTLQVYGHPGDPRHGGFYHVEGKEVREHHKQAARFAFKWYCDHLKKGSKLELHCVDKASCAPMCDRFYYLTFTVCDPLTKEMTTLQAQIMELGRDHLKLGLLRDCHSEKVLAVVKLKEGPREDKANEFNYIKDAAWKSILLDA